MKMKIPVMLIFILFCSTIGFSQEKSKKQIKEEKKIEKQKQVEEMLNAKEFIFIARTALPQGAKTVNLTSSYDVTFNPDFIKSYLPYYGRAYSGVGYGADKGMMFEGKPEEFTVTKQKKNFQVTVVVKGETDTYRMSLSVSTSGSTSLSLQKKVLNKLDNLTA
jgi:hypothetical protein